MEKKCKNEMKPGIHVCQGGFIGIMYCKGLNYDHVVPLQLEYYSIVHTSFQGQHCRCEGAAKSGLYGRTLIRCDSCTAIVIK